MYHLFFKRLIDFVASLTVLLVLFPVLVLAALLLAIVNKGTPFFIQARPGKNEKIFKIIKFKTMTNQTDSNGNLLADDKRLTKIGAFIRKTSLDELPQLLNVVKGEMSLIGPRPLLPEYLALYNTAQKKRHQVKPGITGWAQVNGRNALSWDEKFKHDIWYIEHLSFWLDVKIVLKTIQKVLHADGIAADGSATIGRFKGNE